MEDDNLFVEEVYCSEFIYSQLDVSTTRGIKYIGQADNPAYIVLIINLDSWSKENPYHDRIVEDNLYCTGEGLTEEQELIGGNLALSRCLISPVPIYVFTKLDIDEYKYLGRAKLVNVGREVQYDGKNRLREVYIYRLKLKEYNLYQKLENKDIIKKDILNFTEASELLGISTRTLTEILKANDLPGRKLGRQWYFSRKHLIKWIGEGVSSSQY